jgi:hypothetical protein
VPPLESLSEVGLHDITTHGPWFLGWIRPSRFEFGLADHADNLFLRGVRDARLEVRWLVPGQSPVAFTTASNPFDCCDPLPLAMAVALRSDDSFVVFSSTGNRLANFLDGVHFGLAHSFLVRHQTEKYSTSEDITTSRRYIVVQAFCNSAKKFHWQRLPAGIATSRIPSGRTAAISCQSGGNVFFLINCVPRLCDANLRTVPRMWSGSACCAVLCFSPTCRLPRFVSQRCRFTDL